MANASEIRKAQITDFIKKLKASPSEIRAAVRDMESESPKLPVSVRGDIESVHRMIKNIRIAVHKALDSGEEIPDSIWKEVEKELATISVKNYKDSSLAQEYTKGKRRPGRPKGSKTKNKQTVAAVSTEGKRGPGRPKGSKTKNKQTVAAALTEGKRRPGRPKGSKSKVKAAIAEPQLQSQAEMKTEGMVPQNGQAMLDKINKRIENGKPLSYQEFKQLEEQQSTSAHS